jgi:hypothetical protein
MVLCLGIYGKDTRMGQTRISKDLTCGSGVWAI